MGASWGYFAVACGPAGVNDFGTNIVAINLLGPGGSQPGFGIDLMPQMEGGHPATEVDDLTFNTFSWADYEYLFGGMDLSASERFAEFVDLFSLGPGRGEPVSSPYSSAIGATLDRAIGQSLPILSSPRARRRAANL
jgi:hypothetical protein